MAARDVVLRLAQCGPHELARTLLRRVKREPEDVRKMAQRVWHWFMWGDGLGLSEDEEDFVRQMMEESSPSFRQIQRLETLFARVEEEND
jgi:hypothetical protein